MWGQYCVNETTDYKAVFAVHRDYEKLEELLKELIELGKCNTLTRRLSYVIQKWLRRVCNQKFSETSVVRNVPSSSE